MSTDYRGIDYSLGRSNVNHETGVHYGVISANSCASWIYDAMNEGAEYGQPTCPSCGNAVKASDDASLFVDWDNTPIDEETRNDASLEDQEWFDGKDYACLDCQSCYWSDEVFPEESIGWNYEKDGYKLCDCLDNEIFVLDSPYFTFAQFCSPCVPGACNLDSPLDPPANMRADCYTTEDELADALTNRAYCLGPEWFDADNNTPMPYRCWRVSDGTEVQA